MKVYECKQLSEEWFSLHRGIPTASQADKIITPKTMKMSAQSQDLIADLIAQEFGAPMDPGGFISKEMQHGIDCEPEARNWYAMESNLDIRQVGFCTTDDGRFGCSPDGLVGESGLLELKCPSMKTQAKYLLAGGVPADYLPQVHMQLWVTDRQWLDFVSYASPLPPLVARVVPSDYTAALGVLLMQFWTDYQKALARVKGMA